MSITTMNDFKKVTVVPDAPTLIDAVLYKTQRKTPTQIHPQMKIHRHRAFYILKVKFTMNTIHNKITQLLAEFPKLDEMHPFYRYWFNIMYDKDHYKISLGQLHQCRSLVDRLSKHYVKLLKHGESPFQCKTLKRAALGRMVSLLRRQRDFLAYLEHVRQHMSRLPAIDPSGRSLVLTGFPSVGKSCLLNALSRATVDVQPWAFTTQSLFLGHLEHRLMRWQIIDTPGLLDHPLEQRNNIELQAVTALAYLDACVLFVVDPTEQCGAHMAQQLSLFRSLKPFYTRKPVVIVLTKADLWTWETLSDEVKEHLQAMSPEVPLQACVEAGFQPLPEKEHPLELQFAGRGPVFVVTAGQKKMTDRIQAVACELLLRVRAGRANHTGPRLHVTKPMARDGKPRASTIPASVRAMREGVKPKPIVTEHQMEVLNGGPGVYLPDDRKNWLLEDDAWKGDVIPAILDGKNIIDFVTVDGDIEERLATLEAEEERMAAAGEAIDDTELAAQFESHMEGELHEKPMRQPAQGLDLLNKSLPRKVVLRKRAEREHNMTLKDREARLGLDEGTLVEPLPKRKAKASIMDRMRILAGDSVPEEKLKSLVHLEKDMDRLNFHDGPLALPRHLLTGKRKQGKTDRR